MIFITLFYNFLDTFPLQHLTVRKDRMHSKLDLRKFFIAVTFFLFRRIFISHDFSMSKFERFKTGLDFI